MSDPKTQEEIHRAILEEYERGIEYGYRKGYQHGLGQSRKVSMSAFVGWGVAAGMAIASAVKAFWF